MWLPFLFAGINCKEEGHAIANIMYHYCTYAIT